MGVALSAFVWTYVVGNLIGGPLIDRFGPKAVLGVSFTIWSLFSACTGFAQNITHVIIMRLGVGFSEAPAYPCANKIVAGNFPTGERGTAVGFNMAGARVGLAICPLIMAFLITRWGWRFAFIVTGFGCLLWVAVWLLFFRDLSRTAVTAKDRRPARQKLNWLVMLRNPTMLSFLVVKSTQDFLTWIFLTWIPGYLVTGRGFSVIEMGFYTSLAFSVASISQPCIGFLSDWLIRHGLSVNQARKGVQVTLHLLSATIIISGFCDNVPIAMFFMVLAISAETTSAGHFWTIVTDVIPDAYVGSVSGFLNGIGAIAGVLSPIVTGVLVKLTGNFQLALTIGGSSILIAAAFLLFVVPSLNRPWYDALGVTPEPDAAA
jgi:MFS family permease